MKKGKLIFLVLMVCSFWYSCKDDSEADVLEWELSASSFTGISSEGGTLQVDVTCNGTWIAASSDPSWCAVTPTTGTGSQSITIDIAGNPRAGIRTAIVTVSLDGMSREINISQEAVDFETYHYKLPIIFHVFYKDQTDPLQYVSASRLGDILQVVNDCYRNSSVDMNLTFEPATVDPQGKPMDKPGVEYIEWPEDYPIDYDIFMQDTVKNYVNYLWEPNQYINVMVYNFKFDDSNSFTLGISHLPFSVKGSTFLEGLNPTDLSFIKKENIRFPYSVSINSLFINEQSIGEQYTAGDITVTLAHELGHYLGLHHVFSEAETDGVISGCEDTDYCKDTPSYNKLEYDAYCYYLGMNEPENFTFETLVKRTDCSDNAFTSDNIMDYAVSYSDRFTDDQRSRIRHVLTYSPLIPGPKNIPADTRAASNGVLNLPIRVIK